MSQYLDVEEANLVRVRTIAQDLGVRFYSRISFRGRVHVEYQRAM